MSGKIKFDFTNVLYEYWWNNMHIRHFTNTCQLIVLCTTKSFVPITRRKSISYALKIHHHTHMFKVLELIFGILNSSGSVIDTNILVVLSPKTLHLFFFSKWPEFPRESIQASDSHCDTQTFKKGLEKSPVVHMSVHVYWCFYWILRKKRRGGGGGSECQTTFPVFWNPLRSARAVGFMVGCTVILTQEIHVFLCPVEVTCAAGSSDGNATFTPTQLCVWHVGGPRGGMSLISTSSFPPYSWASANATSEALKQFS